jgi:hypothetical protein
MRTSEATGRAWAPELRDTRLEVPMTRSMRAALDQAARRNERSSAAEARRLIADYLEREASNGA